MEAVWNSLCRQRRMVKLLVFVIALTFWHRSQARSGNVLFLPNALSRFIHNNDSAVCVDDIVGPIVIVRAGGYRDETTEAPVIRQHMVERTSAPKSNNEAFVFSLYQPGDGHETDEDGIPQRYLNMHNGKRELSKASLESTLDWRREQNIDTLLHDPHEHYDIAKTVFPHYFAGRDRENHVVFVQRPGMLSMELAKTNGLSKEALLRTY